MDLSSRLRATAVLAAFAAFSLPAVAGEPASVLVQPAAREQVSFAYFQEQLAPFGRWLRHPVWGDVWQPDAGRSFRPYFYGYWQYTSDYGWLWMSNEVYGDIVYHYGRWVYDPNFGWLWVPGYIWGPSWVAWRETDGYVGWLPMPPGYQDFSFATAAPPYTPNNWYGYQSFYGNNFALDAFLGLWVFAPNQDFGRRDRRPYVTDKDRLRDLYRDSHDQTHYVHDRDHDRIVDRSIDKDALEQSTHRSFGAQEGAQFLRGNMPVTSVTQGQELSRRNRDRWRGPVVSSPNVPAQGSPGSGPLGQDGAADARQNGLGRELRGFPTRYPLPRGAQDANLPVGRAADPAGAVGGEGPHEINVNRSEPTPFAPRRNPSALGAIGVPPPAVAPSTDSVHGAQGAGFPAVIPHAGALPGAFPSTMAPGGVLGRAGSRGLGEPQIAPVPSVANVGASAVVQRAAGLQQLPGLQQAPIAPPPAIAPPLAPAPPPVVPAAQSAAPQPYQRSPIGRFPQRDQGP